MLTSSWTQRHVPLGWGTGLELIDPPQACVLVLVSALPCSASLGRGRGRHPLPGIILGIHFPFSLPPSLHHSSGKLWLHPALTQTLLQASLGLRSHVVSSRSLLHAHLSYLFLLHSAPAIGLQSFPARLFPTSGSRAPFPSCLTWNKALFLLHTCFLSNKMGWSFPTGGQEGGQFLTLSQVRSGQG